MIEKQHIGGGLSEMLTRIAARVEADERAWAALPCHAARQAGRIADAADACIAVGAHSTCPFRTWADDCPIALDGASYRNVAERLSAAHVEPLERDLILGAMPGARTSKGERRPRLPLRDTDPLRLVRTFIGGGGETVQLSDGAAVEFAGDERLLVLGGSVGVGKTLAACWALGQRPDGMYCTAASLTELEAPLDDAKHAKVLVPDDLGVEYGGESGFAIARINGVLDTRHARKLMTIATTNLKRRRSTPNEPAQFAERYGRRLDDRLNDGGLFVLIAGASLRGAK